MSTGLLIHFNEDPFVDSSGQNKVVTNSGVTITQITSATSGGQFGVLVPEIPSSFQEDEFDDDVVAGFWTQVVGPGSSGITEQNDRLEIEMSTANNFAGDWNPNGVYQPLSGNFDIYVKMANIAFDHNYQTAVLDASRSDLSPPNNYVRVGKHYSSGLGAGGSIIGYSNPPNGNSNVTPYTSSELWVRMRRIGSAFDLYYATSEPYINSDWTLINVASQWTYSGTVNIWLHTSDPFAGSGTPYFEYIRNWGEFSTAYLQIDKANVLQPNTENWEVDLIVEHTILAGQQTYYGQYEDANNRCKLEHVEGYGLHFLYRYNGTDLISLSGAAGEITDIDEHHVALSKAGNTFRLFLDGVNIAETTYTFSGSELIDSDIFIGQDGNSDNYFNGIMNTFRISNTTRFTQDFIPDMSGTYETDEFTQLLINFSGTSPIDSAEAGLSVWNPGQVIWGNRDVGTRIVRFGDLCGYFSGTQDGFAPYSVQLADHPNWYLADDDFTLEGWVRPLSHFNYAGIIHQNTRYQLYIDSAGKLNWYVEDGGPPLLTMQSSGTVPLDEWSHLALTRSLEPTAAGDKDAEILFISGPCVGAYGQAKIAQSITPTEDWIVFDIEVDVVERGSATHGFARIYTDTGGNADSGTILAESPEVDVSGAPTLTRFPIPSGVSLSSGVTYWIVFYGTTVGKVNLDGIQFTRTGSSVYAGGGLQADFSSNDPGTNWQNNPTLDVCYLKLFGLTGATIQVWRMYINGVIQAITRESVTMPNLTGPFWVGRGTSTNDLFHGYMQQLRLFIGKAIWTEDEFWPYDYKYQDEPVGLYVPVYRRRIHSIKGR